MYYYLIPQLALGLVMAAFMALMVTLMASMPAEAAKNPGAEAFQKLLGGFGAIGVGLGYFLFFIIIAPLGIFIGSGINHLMLKLWGAAKAPFEVTFRATAYTMGAFALASVPLQMFGMIPCVGIIFSMVSLALFVWVVIIQIKAYSITHGASVGRCAGAVLTPIIVCCCGGAILYGAIFAAVIGAHHP